DPARDGALLAAAGRFMQDSGIEPQAFFHTYRGGRGVTDPALTEALAGYRPIAGALDHPAWGTPSPSNHIDEVERIWAAIDEGDDWGPLHAHVAAIRALGDALGEAPAPAGHQPG
ncbi:MAG TPA: selenoprotein O, partial [Novosphingobium sp.]|nr:selenoprotein O [Novosphingobium sp.]